MSNILILNFEGVNLKKLFIIIIVATSFLNSQNSLTKRIDKAANQIEQKVIDWRRDFHQNPELSNREFRTSKIVAEHLKSLGFEVQINVAKTGVVAILKGGKPGAVVALRADMDGLPVTERNALPFCSKAVGEYNGQKVGVMHACGHDSHVAILMGAAEVLSKYKNEISGTIKFIFQPAEEGSPKGEEGGAELMVAEGVLENPKVDAIFGLHIDSQLEVGKLSFTSGGAMASSNTFTISVHGKQTHGASPWDGIDPIVISSQIVLGLQTIVSRQINLTEYPAVITVGKISGGVRSNIIPENVEMVGTIRTLDTTMQKQIFQKIEQTAKSIGHSAGAIVDVKFSEGNPVTINDIQLGKKMFPTLQRVAKEENVFLTKPEMGAEDFAFYVKKIPGFYFVVGGMPKGKTRSEVAAHHTPDFFIDEGGFTLGVKVMCNLAIDYLEMNK